MLKELCINKNSKTFRSILMERCGMLLSTFASSLISVTMLNFESITSLLHRPQISTYKNLVGIWIDITVLLLFKQ